jgi:alkanesulfonate monooxygenase SsuD/methylene tetrahydromethanopterin reductase-like flavin-dependent oxidoreductase (luciferase family)
VEFAVVNLGDSLPNPHTQEACTDAEKHVRLIDQAVTAEAAGFDAFQLGEHHFCDYIFSAPTLALAAVAQHTQQIRLGTGVSLLAVRDPVFLAAEFTTLDALSGGRAEITVGRGIFDNIYRACGLSMEQSPAVLDEFTELLARLLTEENVSWQGKFRPPLEAVTIRPRPVQPVIPLWTGSTSSVAVSARLGLPSVWIAVLQPLEELAGLASKYRAAWCEQGREESDVRLGAAVHFHVAKTSQEARARFWPYYRNYLDCFTPPKMRAQLDVEQMYATVPVCGSPQEVIDRIGQAEQSVGLTRIALCADIGGISQAEVLDVLELTGAEVIPAFTHDR